MLKYNVITPQRDIIMRFRKNRHSDLLVLYIVTKGYFMPTLIVSNWNQQISCTKIDVIGISDVFRIARHCIKPLYPWIVSSSCTDDWPMIWFMAHNALWIRQTNNLQSHGRFNKMINDFLYLGMRFKSKFIWFCILKIWWTSFESKFDTIWPDIYEYQTPK